jgi:4-amino-4-deoxy-L-arabinose transferase-like glycosyltransferase
MPVTGSAVFPALAGTLDRGRAAFWVVIGIGLLVRLALLSQMVGVDTEIIDEQHYRQLAENVLAGHGFGWGAGQPTSIRPPLYPGLLALTWAIAGHVDLQAVRLLQICLALLTTGLVYALGSRAFGPAVGRWAAAVFWLYPSLVFFNLVILTETLFTLLLVAFLYATVRLFQTLNPGLALVSGLVLGAAALTRSVLWPLPILLCPLLLLTLQTSWRRRTALTLIVLAGYVSVVAPWAVRNTRVQGVLTIVDTMGGLNLRMGNYEFTPDDRMWDAVAIEGTKSWSYSLLQEMPGASLTEGQKEKWAQRKAVEYMQEHPWETLRRSTIKFSDFWGLEREFVAGVRQELYDPPRWFVVLASLATGAAYPVVIILAVLGLWTVSPRDFRYQIVLLLPVVMIMGVHTIVFGHSRYHLPLVPILAVYAAAFIVDRNALHRDGARVRMAGAAATCLVLIGIWTRQIVTVDFGRLKEFLEHVYRA